VVNVGYYIIRTFVIYTGYINLSVLILFLGADRLEVCCIPSVSEDDAASIFRVEESNMKMCAHHTYTGLAIPDSWERQMSQCSVQATRNGSDLCFRLG